MKTFEEIYQLREKYENPIDIKETIKNMLSGLNEKSPIFKKSIKAQVKYFNEKLGKNPLFKWFPYDSGAEYIIYAIKDEDEIEDLKEFDIKDGDIIINCYGSKGFFPVLFNDENIQEIQELFDHEYTHKQQYSKNKSGTNSLMRAIQNGDDDRFEQYATHHTEIDSYARQFATRIIYLYNSKKIRGFNENLVRKLISNKDSVNLALDYAMRHDKNAYHRLLKRTYEFCTEFGVPILKRKPV